MRCPMARPSCPRCLRPSWMPSGDIPATVPVKSRSKSSCLTMPDILRRAGCASSWSGAWPLQSAPAAAQIMNPLPLDERRTSAPKTCCEYCGGPIDGNGDSSAGDGNADAMQAIVRIALWFKASPTATSALLSRLADPAASCDALRAELETATGQTVTRQAIFDRLRRAAILWPELAPILQPRACGRFKDRPASRGGRPTHRRTVGVFVDGRKIA